MNTNRPSTRCIDVWYSIGSTAILWNNIQQLEEMSHKFTQQRG